jgi:hypothetical protein
MTAPADRLLLHDRTYFQWLRTDLKAVGGYPALVEACPVPLHTLRHRSAVTGDLPVSPLGYCCLLFLRGQKKVGHLRLAQTFLGAPRLQADEDASLSELGLLVAALHQGAEKEEAVRLRRMTAALRAHLEQMGIPVTQAWTAGLQTARTLAALGLITREGPALSLERLWRQWSAEPNSTERGLPAPEAPDDAALLTAAVIAQGVPLSALTPRRQEPLPLPWLAAHTPDPAALSAVLRTSLLDPAHGTTVAADARLAAQLQSEAAQAAFQATQHRLAERGHALFSPDDLLHLPAWLSQFPSLQAAHQAVGIQRQATVLPERPRPGRRRG